MVKIVYGERIGRLGKVSVGCSAVIFDERREKILLTRRDDNGRWCLPGGHMEAGESVTEACVREVWEETGLRAEVTRLIGIYSNPHMLLEYPNGHRKQLCALSFEAKVTDGELTLSNETTEFGYFTPEEIAQMDVMEHHVQRIKDAISERETPVLE